MKTAYKAETTWGGAIRFSNARTGAMILFTHSDGGNRYHAENNAQAVEFANRKLSQGCVILNLSQKEAAQ